MMGEVTLQDVYTLQIRRQSNVSNPSPYCEACKNGFVHVNSIQVRQFTQTGKLPGVCRSCNNSFLRICRLQIRHLTHSESHAHVCPICDKSFTHAGNIKKHMLLHEQKESQSEESMKAEGETSSNKIYSSGRPKPPFECKDCGRVFIKYGSFIKHCNRHEEEATPSIDLDSIELSNVNIQGNEISSNPNHNENANKASEERFACEQCDRTFSRQGYLIRHYQYEHEAEFQCKVCEKMFKSKPLLSSHMRSHKHVCKLCKNSFMLPEQLELHLQNHVQERVEVSESRKVNHVCSVCQKSFVHLAALKKHFLLHTGHSTMPQSQTTKSASKLQSKIGKKHKIYRCKFCSKYYKFRRTLNKHVAESHK